MVRIEIDRQRLVRPEQRRCLLNRKLDRRYVIGLPARELTHTKGAPVMVL